MDLPEKELEALVPLLSAEEVARADKFYFPRDQKRYIAGRGMLRKLLGQYLDKSPASIELTYTPYGKPFLKQDALKFNLSHASGMVSYAFCHDQEVGIDIEWQYREVDINILVERFFSPAEIFAIRQLQGAARKALFFRFWTRKEAFLKAMGMGVSFPLEQVTVSTQSGNHWSQVDWIGEGSDKLIYEGLDVDFGNGYLGAIVVANPPTNPEQ